jgi:hypothetical protein
VTTEIIEKELSYKIIQAAFEVHNQLGPGFLESIYEEAMQRELRQSINNKLFRISGQPAFNLPL